MLISSRVIYLKQMMPDVLLFKKEEIRNIINTLKQIYVNNLGGKVLRDRLL